MQSSQQGSADLGRAPSTGFQLNRGWQTDAQYLGEQRDPGTQQCPTFCSQASKVQAKSGRTSHQAMHTVSSQAQRALARMSV